MKQAGNGRAALTMAAICTLLLVAASTQARTIQDPDEGRRLLAALDDSIWIADGPASDRHVYVIFSTDCGWCRRLHSESRERDDDVQLRWLLHGGIGRGAEYVAEQGTMDAVALAFGRRAPEADSPEQAIRKINVNAWIQPLIGGDLAYPSFVYQGGAGVEVAVGMRGDLDDLLAQVAARPGTAGHQSASTRLLARPFPSRQPASPSRFVNFEPNALPLHVLPALDAPRIGEVGPMGLYEQVLGFVDGAWIEVAGMRTADGRAVPAYIHAPQAVALAQMAFTVVPATGQVVAEGGPRPIHTHPSRRSPVLDELQPGYRLGRVGEVSSEGETWDVVVLFQDGGHAYIPRL